MELAFSTLKTACLYPFPFTLQMTGPRHFASAFLLLVFIAIRKHYCSRHFATASFATTLLLRLIFATSKFHYRE